MPRVSYWNTVYQEVVTVRLGKSERNKKDDRDGKNHVPRLYRLFLKFNFIDQNSLFLKNLLVDKHLNLRNIYYNAA